MSIRWYAAFAALATLVFLWFAADYAGLWKPAPAAGVQSASLRATWTIDLDTGAQGTPQADLHWGMAARDQPYLAAVQRSTGRGALIAQAGATRWEDLNQAMLAQLNYAPNRFSAWGPDAPVQRGAVFAVRTDEGNFAKLRVVEVRDDYQLRLEWQLYPAAKKETQQSARTEIAPAPSIAWRDLRDEALAAYKAQRYQEALDACGRAVAAAEPAGAPQHALALVSCGGLLGLHRRAARQTEDWLKQAAAIATRLDQQAIVAALGPREFMLKERCLRMLGVFYRDRNRTREAAENFALAVDTVRAMPPLEMGAQRLALRADLHDLGTVLAQLGLRATARQALAESRELYLQTEPSHTAIKSIDDQLKRLEAPEG